MQTENSTFDAVKFQVKILLEILQNVNTHVDLFLEEASKQDHIN